MQTKFYAEQLQTEPHYVNNRFILKWWSPSHDQLLRLTIKKQHWIWYWSISNDISDMTPSSAIEYWKVNDPLCQKYSWYNVLMYFAAARAKELGLYKLIRNPESLECPICGKSFREDSIPPSVVHHLRIDQIDICGECISNGFFHNSGNNRIGRLGIIQWIRDITNQMGIIPHQNLFESLSGLTGLNTEERVILIKLAERRPTMVRVKSLFDTWLNALVQAGVLDNGVRETTRGTQALAKDGHVCFSLGEKTIDDYLFRNGVPHSREPRYPESNFRADFKIGEYFVEYFGLAGDREYDIKTEKKRKLAKQHRISLIELYPIDLASETVMAKKLQVAIRSLDV